MRTSSLSTLSALVAACVLALTLPAAYSQGVPHLSVTPKTFRTLVPKNLPITAAMCQPGNTFCLNSLAGSANVITSVGAYTTDVNGNSYVFDDATFVIYKITPAGAVTVLAGQTPTAQPQAVPTTARAADLIFGMVTSMATDLAGNLYVDDSFEATPGGSPVYLGSIIKIDPLGVATRLTGVDPTLPPAAYTSLASNQLRSPQFIATDLIGNIYYTELGVGSGITNDNTCEVRKIAAGYGTVRSIAGTGFCVSSYIAPTPGQLATTYALDSVERPLAVGGDGTVYFIAFQRLTSVTPDGVIHVLTQPDTIGSPTGDIAVDPAGNVYLGTGDPDQNVFGIAEVTKGGGASPSQIIPVTGFQGIAESSDGNADGIPATSAAVSPNAPYFGFQHQHLALDAAGRLLVLPRSADYVAVLDRNGSVVFDTNGGGATQQTITLTNSGTATIVGQNFGNTGRPFNEMLPGSAFSIDQNSGTCLAKFAAPGGLTLVPGESCSLVIDYSSSNQAPLDAFTFYTNDPLGPLTVNLSATNVTNGLCPECASQFAVSIPKLTLDASISTTGQLNAEVTVLSSVTDGSNETSITPSGPVDLIATNNATGVQQYAAGNLSGGSTTVSMHNVAPGTYSVQVVYAGGGGSAPSFSPAQTFYSGGSATVPLYASTSSRFVYSGATPQMLNFSAQMATNPAPVQFQDLISGKNVLAFNLKNSLSQTLDPTSPSAMPVGNYTVQPVLPNAESLDYSVIAHTAAFSIAPATVTVRNNSKRVAYGQALNATLDDATHFTLASTLQIAFAPPILQTEIAAGTVTLATSTAGLTPDGNGFLPVGRYPLIGTLTGPGAGNYSFGSYGSTLEVVGSYLVLMGGNFTASHTQTIQFSQLCRYCVTAPNTNLLLNDPNLTIGFKIMQGATLVKSVTYPFSPFLLQVGDYTVVPTFSGPGVPNYQAGTANGTIHIR